MKNDGSGLPQSLISEEVSANLQTAGGSKPQSDEETRQLAKIWLDNFEPQGHLSDGRHKGAHIIPVESIDPSRPCRCYKH